MSTPLHNDPAQNITAGEGWQGMQLLLDKHLPVQPAPVKRKPVFFYFAAACLVLLLMLSYLHVQKDHGKKMIIAGDKNGANGFTATGTAKVTLASSGKIFSPTVISPEVFDNGRKKAFQQATLSYMEEGIIRHFYSNANSGAVAKTNVDQQEEVEDQLLKTTKEKHMIAAVQNMELIAGNGYSMPGGLHRYTGQPEKNNRLTGKEKNDPSSKKRTKGWWEAGVGAGINAVIDNEISSRPYPVAELKYNFSPKVYVSLGLSAFSPVNSHSRSINKTVYVNDTANNLRSYNEVMSYTRFEYADIPVMAGFRISKRFAVQAGAQVSLLMGQQKRRDVAAYDFQMNPSSSNSDVVSLSPISSDVFEATPRKIDTRMIGGISYTASHVTVNLSYQQALQAAVRGSQVSSGKNRLVSLQVLYRLKK